MIMPSKKDLEKFETLPPYTKGCHGQNQTNKATLQFFSISKLNENLLASKIIQ
jgi:hypothetical protein